MKLSTEQASGCRNQLPGEGQRHSGGGRLAAVHLDGGLCPGHGDEEIWVALQVGIHCNLFLLLWGVVGGGGGGSPFAQSTKWPWLDNGAQGSGGGASYKLACACPCWARHPRVSDPNFRTSVLLQTIILDASSPSRDCTLPPTPARFMLKMPADRGRGHPSRSCCSWLQVCAGVPGHWRGA